MWWGGAGAVCVCACPAPVTPPTIFGTHGRDPRAVPGAPAPPRAAAAAFSSSLPPTQREIEGAGGEMWYEARHFGAGRAA